MFVYTDEGSISTPSADEALALYFEALDYSESPSIWKGDPAKSDWQPVTPDDLIDVAADEFSRKADAALVAAFEHDQMLWFSMEEFSDPDPRIKEYQRDTSVGAMLLWTVLEALIFTHDEGEYEEDFQPWGDTCSLRVGDVSISMFDCSAWRESQLVVTDWSTLSLDDPDGLVQYTLTAGSEADNADLEHAPEHAFMV